MSETLRESSHAAKLDTQEQRGDSGSHRSTFTVDFLLKMRLQHQDAQLAGLQLFARGDPGITSQAHLLLKLCLFGQHQWKPASALQLDFTCAQLQFPTCK